jgi:hypothetical protein
VSYDSSAKATAFAVYLGMVRAYAKGYSHKRVFPAAVRGWKEGKQAVDVARGVAECHFGTLAHPRLPIVS